VSDVNIELVKERAREVRQCVTTIRRYTDQPDDVLLSDERNLYTVQFQLLIAIEAIAAVCNHLLARTAHSAPASYAECAEGLRDAGVINDELADRLKGMFRFRNLLVHRYWQVDQSRVLAYARHDIADFESYLSAVGRWLEREL
jgi:uncharacterized protein YutE (UPF0331/DUF86 family)